MKEDIALENLRECNELDDTELAYTTAVDILAEFIENLGYWEIVDEFYKIKTRRLDEWGY